MTSLFPKPVALCGLLLCLLCALAPSTVRAQGTTAAIRGTVTDQDGESLPGANVVAVHQPSGTRYGTSTDAEGRYNLQGLRVGGPYRVTVTFVGYQEVSETDFSLTLGQTRTIDFELAEAAKNWKPSRWSAKPARSSMPTVRGLRRTSRKKTSNASPRSSAAYPTSRG